jgi:hypothetical protein
MFIDPAGIGSRGSVLEQVRGLDVDLKGILVIEEVRVEQFRAHVGD